MIRFLSKVVTVLALGGVLISSAGATCLLSTVVRSAPAGSAHAKCHSSSPSSSSSPSPSPSNPHPVELRCCISHPASALPTNVFSPRSSLHSLGFARISGEIVLVLGNRLEVRTQPAPSGGPPAVTALRI